MAEDYSELSHKTQVLVGMSVLSKPRLVLVREGKKAAGQEKRRKKSVLEKLTKKKKTTKKTRDSSGQLENATISQPTVGVIPDLNDALPDLNAYQPPMTSWNMPTYGMVPSQQSYAPQNQYGNVHSYVPQQSYAPPTHQEPLGSNVNYGQPWSDESLTQESYFGYNHYGSNQDGGDYDNNNNFN